MPPTYAPLTAFLAASDPFDHLVLTFKQIEVLLQHELPRSAYDHRPWWGNDPTHIQAQAWLEAGWHVEALELTFRTVTFARTGRPEER